MRPHPPGPGIVVVGAGGHGKVVIEAARAAGLAIAGLVDPRSDVPDVLGVPILGGDDRLPALFAAGHRRAFVAVGDNAARVRIGEALRAAGFALVSIVHPSALLSPSSRLGEGVLVMPRVVVNASARIGDHVILNTGAIVEHDCDIGDGCHLAPASALAGGCILGRGVLFGIGAVARPGSIIGAGSTIGAGSVVAGNIYEGTTCFGVPARPVGRHGH